MTKEEMCYILSEHLNQYRSWSYSQLVKYVDKGYLKTAEGTAPDGTDYQMDFQVFWDDEPLGNIRVIGSFWAEPKRPLLGFIPIYTPDATNCFIMCPDGKLIDE